MNARATGIDGTDVDLAKCRECEHHQETMVFDLCKRTSSMYSIAGKTDFHTIGHMRTVGGCGKDAVLFSPIHLKRAA